MLKPITNKFKKGDIIAFSLCIFALIIWMSVLLHKYSNLCYFDWDLALYAHSMWNLMHGNLHNSLLGMHFWGNHSHFIAIFILPIYTLFTTPLTLVFLQVLSYLGGAYIYYLIIRDLLGKRVSLIFMCLYIIYPVNLYAMLYEFHFYSPFTSCKIT